jgi:mono/diheme cytochrome c family protein
MRIASAVTFLLGSLLLQAQDAPKISKVGATPTSAASGKEMFRSYCASCHGAAGKGNGPAAAALKKAPTDLTILSQKNGGKYPSLQVMNSIKDGNATGHGSKDMPVWGPILSSVSGNDPAVVDQRVANLVGYIESLQAK